MGKQDDSKNLDLNDSNNNKEKGMDKNDITIYNKEKNKSGSNSPKLKKNNSSKLLKVHKKKSLKRNSTKSKYKCHKSNSLVQRNKPLEERKKTLQDELKKINDFRKILTKNSKIYARKYGDEILKKILSLSNKSNKIKINKNNKEFVYHKRKSKINGSRFMSNKNAVISNKTFKKLITSQKNINVNIINSFKIINEKNKRRRKSYEKGDLNNYFKKYELIKDNKKPRIEKSDNNISSVIRYCSFNNKREIIKKKVQPKLMFEKIQYSKKSFKPESIQLYHNISLNYNPIFINKIKDKKEDTNKIVFYSILLNNLYNKFLSENSMFVKSLEEKEEEKKRFLYQLYYCLGLTKIYILNFKEKKFPNLFSEGILSLKNNKNNNDKKLSNFSENSGIRFKTFYETFSNYSQIKISTLEKYEAYPGVEQVNQYLIFKDKQIGKGGSSVVYLGEDEKKQRKYAIKVTDKNLKANPFKLIYDYVKEEVSILKRIHSKYIVTTYEVIESRNRIYIIMEYMSLGSVFNLIDQIDENQIKHYTRNLICAVEHCHKIANIIHKDINVNNLLINEEGEAKLCDFGISEVFEEDNDILSSKGPSTYTPPEKKYNETYRGKPADIYLIGLTLYHMVFKKPLFTDFGNLTKNDYININIPKKDGNNKDIDPNLYDLLKSLLSFNPDERPNINKLKRDPWLTDNMKNPFPDVIKEALFYSLELTRNQINNEKDDISLKDIKEDNNHEFEETEEDEEEEEETEEEEEIESIEEDNA